MAEARGPERPQDGVTPFLTIAGGRGREALDMGARVARPVADPFWGDPYGQLRDPHGHTWSVGGLIKA